MTLFSLAMVVAVWAMGEVAAGNLGGGTLVFVAAILLFGAAVGERNR